MGMGGCLRKREHKSPSTQQRFPRTVATSQGYPGARFSSALRRSFVMSETTFLPGKNRKGHHLPIEVSVYTDIP